MADDMRERVRAAYEAAAAGFERNWSAPRAWMNPGYEAFAANVSPGGRVLDIGCNFGLDSERWHRHGFRVTGIDLSAAAIARARERVPGATFEVCDLLELEPARFGRFDAAWASFSLVHVERARMPEALAHVHGLLVAGGWLFMAMSRADRTIEEIKPIVGLEDPQGRDLAAPIVHWAVPELEALVRAAGFDLRWSAQIEPFPGGGGALSLWRS